MSADIVALDVLYIECAQCALGRFTNLPLRNAECLRCAPGQFGDIPGENCSLCAFGQYRNIKMDATACGRGGGCVVSTRRVDKVLCRQKNK